MVAFVVGLLLFGPEGLPQMARKAGRVFREVQNTSQAFLREMERAAELPSVPDAPAPHEEAEHPHAPH
jgi:Sec-independent protein translocase protein TatA